MSKEKRAARRGLGERRPWVTHKWDNEYPACVRCGTDMYLRAGCEWEDDQDFNLCYYCAMKTLKELAEVLEEKV